jgi:hypothetical protein
MSQRCVVRPERGNEQLRKLKERGVVKVVWASAGETLNDWMEPFYEYCPWHSIRNGPKGKPSFHCDVILPLGTDSDHVLTACEAEAEGERLHQRKSRSGLAAPGTHIPNNSAHFES